MVLWGPRTVVSASGRVFPDTSTRIGILTDQLPGGMTAAQERFAATHYVGTQKLTLNLSRPLRAINPHFLVLHYHLAMWQSAPRVNFIVDGNRWANDYHEVTRHESWFWHNPANQRVASNQDGKLLMNVSDPGFRRYWSESIAAQVQAGDYDGVFLDSASPALSAVGGAQPGRSAASRNWCSHNTFPEFGGKNWISAWEDWIRAARSLARGEGYSAHSQCRRFRDDLGQHGLLAHGRCVLRRFLDPGLSTIDWKAAMNQTLSLVRQNKIVILQNYLVRRRTREATLPARELLAGQGYANLPVVLRVELARLVSRVDARSRRGANDCGQRSTICSGTALIAATSRTEWCWSIPSERDVRVDLGGSFRRIVPDGGGAVGPDGAAGGRNLTSNVTTIEIPGKSAEILLR